jgi:PBP1b-binding outer membrane lipoprotein LpoB
MKKHLTASLLGAALLLAGCATAEMDWSHQVGELTFD